MIVDKQGLVSELKTVLNEATSNPNTMPGVIAGVTDAKKTLFLEALGIKEVGHPEAKVGRDDRLYLFSCTKAMTVMGALILYDRKLLNFDIPALTYLPLIGDIGILDEELVDLETGEIKLPPKKPNNPVTIRHLITHTAGFSYSFLHPVYMALTKVRPEVNGLQATRAYFCQEKIPLTFEPGTEWAYGHNIDWLGVIIEEVLGMKLGQFLQKEIFAPAHMDHTTFYFTDPYTTLKLHMRGGNGDVKWLKKYPLKVPEQDMGGQGCWLTVGDYLKFMRIYLNDGQTAEGTRIIKKSTMRYAMQNHLPIGLGVLTMMNDAGWDLPADAPLDGFSLTGHGVNGVQLPLGRPQGAVYWLGIGNLYYWIDYKNGIAGFWGQQLLPYLDGPSLEYYRRFETTVYNHVSDTSTKL